MSFISLVKTFKATLIITLTSLCFLAGTCLGGSSNPAVASHRQIIEVIKNLVEAQPDTSPPVFPYGTKAVALNFIDDRCELVLSQEAVQVEPIPTDLYYEAMIQVLMPYQHIHSFTIMIADPQGAIVPLEQYRPQPLIHERALESVTFVATLPYTGALTGKQIFVSPGHGWIYDEDVGGYWRTQRGYYHGSYYSLNEEDFHNSEICRDFLIPALEHAGALVYACRDRDNQPEEVVVDSDAPSSGYTEIGTGWATGSSIGFHGGTYRYHECAAGSSAKAVFQPSLPEGDYTVWTAYRAGTNRSQRTLIEIGHSGGISYVELNQEVNDLRMVFLGTYHFEAGDSGYVAVCADGNDPGQMVIADWVRFGGGYGSIPRGSAGVSGEPRWEEGARYWLEYYGAPASVYDSSSTVDRWDGTYARPLFAEWQVTGTGGAPASPTDCLFLSIHTNAYTEPNVGTGTSTFTDVYDSAIDSASKQLQEVVHTQLIADIRALWSSTWRDRGQQESNFIELSAQNYMPAMLFELAFHDTDNPSVGWDVYFLLQDEFRRDTARAIYKGVAKYYDPGAVIYPLPPLILSVKASQGQGIVIAWHPVTDPLEASATADYYRVYRSSDGKGFDDGTDCSGTSYLDDEATSQVPYFYKVTAVNEGGESFSSEVLGCAIGPPGAPSILVVNGFDRLDQSVTIRNKDNTFDYVRQHGFAITAAGYGFDSSSNEAVLEQAVRLQDYACIDWMLGEESSGDETLATAEQNLVQAYLLGGGTLLASGAEIAWDLDHLGTTSDKAFIHELLKTSYVQDDAETYRVSPVAGALFDGISAFSFDNGAHGTYNVDWPDVIATASGGAACLMYDSSGVAAVSFSGSYRVVVASFPFETIYPEATRNEVMARALNFCVPYTAATATPTLTPTAWQSPTPRQSPTPIPEVIVTIFLNQQTFTVDDRFLLILTVDNTDSSIAADAYVVLEVYGAYWFWPSWRVLPQLDHGELDLTPWAHVDLTILDFGWPPGAGAAEGLYFWSFLCTRYTLDLISNVSWVVFAYH